MKLRFIVLFSLVCVFMLFTNCSFAYTIDDFIVFCSTVKDDFSNGSWSANFILQTESNFRNVVGNSYDSFVVIQSQASVNGTRVYVRNTPTTPSVSINNITFSGNDRNNWKELYYYEGWHLINYTGYFTNLSSISSYGLLVTNNDITNWGNMFFNNKFVPPYTGPVFNPSNNGTIQVIASNNLSENMLRLPFTYTGQSDWTLGYLTDYDEVYSVFGYFGPLFYKDDQLFTESYQNEFSYNINSGSRNSGLIFDPSTGRISIRRESLVNKQGYNLLLRYRLSTNDEVEDIDDLNYYAYFYNLSVSSGDLVSPDINSNVDIGMLNALDDFVNNNSNEQYYYDNALFLSGDFWGVSGDLFGIPYRSYDNFGLHSFIKNTFMNFITFLSNNSNISINFGFLGIWNSSQFVMPQNAFTSLVSIVANGLLVLYAGFALYRYFNLLSTFDLDALTNTDEVMNWF